MKTFKELVDQEGPLSKRMVDEWTDARVQHYADKHLAVMMVEISNLTQGGMLQAEAFQRIVLVTLANMLAAGSVEVEVEEAGG